MMRVQTMEHDVSTLARSFAAPRAAAGVPDRSICEACEIRHLAMCSVLDDDEVGRLDAIVSHIRLDPGRALFYEGDERGHVFTVAIGTLRLYKMLADGRRQITGFLYPGDFLGFAARQGYSYTAEAVTEAAVCRFRVRDLETLFDEFPKLEKRVLGMARDELVAAQEQMLLLGRKTPVEKIASFLLGLSRRAERWELPASPVILSMSRSDIADFLGLTVETVSRTFTRMRSEGVIDLPESHRVVLNDIEQLEELAEGS